jgi:hypothetical protein
MESATSGDLGTEFAVRDPEMSDATQDRHRCHNPECGRPFAVVYHRSWHDVPMPLAVACPRCGSWDVVMVSTGAGGETQGTWVLPLDQGIAALEA